MEENRAIKMQLEEYPDVFADIINVLIFNGKTIVKPEELITESSFNSYENKKFEHRVTKVWSKGHIIFSYVAFENPIGFNKYIPLRSISYDGAIYGSELDTAESVADLYPVINLVLYFGYEYRWKAPLSLKTCFHIPKQLQPYLSDYKTNLFEMAWLPDEIIAKFQSDFRFVVEYYIQAQKQLEWEPMYGEAKHINELFELFYDMTDDERFLIILEEPRLGGNSKMPSIVLDRIENRGMMMGRDDGLITGKEYGKEELAKFLLQKEKVTIDDIQEATGWEKSRIKNLLRDDDDPYANIKKRILK